VNVPLGKHHKVATHLENYVELLAPIGFPSEWARNLMRIRRGTELEKLCSSSADFSAVAHKLRDVLPSFVS
jgi:hypothetical protein